MTELVEIVDGTLFQSPEAFERRIVNELKPIVLKGFTSHWPCVAAASTSTGLCDYLRLFMKSQTTEVFFGTAAISGRYYYGAAPGSFNFDRVQMVPSEALDRILECARDSACGSVYMGSLDAATYLPEFAVSNKIEAIRPNITPRFWIGNASNIACHYDTFDNLACVIAGHRRFTLYPPDAIGDLYVGPIDHTMAGQPVSLAASDPDHIDRYPRFAKVRPLVAELAQGDALYLPKLWWHQVEALEPFNVLVNYWWDAFEIGPDAPMLSMLLAMIAIAERPVAERQAFRAFFDHYVFRLSGHPLAHLVEDERGILKNIDSHAYGRIRTMIMRELRRG